MSFCQPHEGFSCGACCGLLNLKLSNQHYSEILKKRTLYFRQNVDFKKPDTIINYRARFEELESDYEKKDPHIYNCPFLGYIDSLDKKIGCMIHPANSGDPKSQNYSFYGASICQEYDCKNKEKPNIDLWSKLLKEIDLDSIQYSRLAGDHILFTRIEEYFGYNGISAESIFSKYYEIVLKVLRKTLEQDTGLNITSFELEMIAGSKESALDRLCERAGIKEYDDLRKELGEIIKTDSLNGHAIDTE